MMNQDKDPVSILVVDDNPKNIMAIEDTLTPLDENIVSVNSGKAALKLLLNNEYAVILMDVNMPEMDGFETSSLIRKSKKTERTPIIFLTAFDDGQKEILKAYKLGAVDYIVKPYIAEILLAKVQFFTDLYRMREEIIRKKQIEKEKEQTEKELKKALQSLNKLSMWQEDGTITASISGIGPLKERLPEVFAEVLAEYSNLLEQYLNVIGFADPPPRAQIKTLAYHVGSLGGGPKDVIDIHMRVVIKKSKNVSLAREKVYAMEGRLLALEFMGFLVDYYRSMPIAQTLNPKKSNSTH